MEGMTRQRIKDRPINYVEVHINIEDGCNVSEGEYSYHISAFTGSLDISSIGGVDDISLIKECIDGCLSDPTIEMHEEGLLHLVLKEDGEWEDVFWHKYYVLERSCWLDYV